MKERVFEFLLTIPKGKVVTYGQIAEYLGNKRAARAVGNILHYNPDENKYPCYKVVDSKGNLSKSFAFGGIENQKKKLETEGIEVNKNKVDLNKYKWQETK
ncbi:MAG: MGMT family protein [Oscillospiraceae bacterium]|nr:MGMT family protein [Oscillospiraceae bacterium]